MTLIKCPHGCGGTVNTETHDYCPSCRRQLAEVGVIIPEDANAEKHFYGMEAHKLSWCWEWWGPEHHRMRCRLRKGHPPGEHDTHERRMPNTLIVSTEGDAIQ